ncbi:MAG: betaine/proline/choline family ABC transporter ATP-binding protein [Thermovirgaceae bacterium]
MKTGTGKQGHEDVAFLALRRVAKRYPDGTNAVSGLDLEIHRGEILVLIGPSGCGKTTTLRMINRLVEPTEGEITIGGEDTSLLDPVVLRRRIGYVIQGIGLFPHLRVRDNVSVVPRLKGVARLEIPEKVRQTLELVGLPLEEYGDRWPSDLSGGQKQRVGVARALAGDPEIILMDEPFGALDPITRIGLQDELLSLQERLRKTVVFVTHDINEAMKMGDRVAIMRDGRVVQVNSPLDLLAKPADEFIADFVGAGNPLSLFRYLKIRDVPIRTENLPVVVATSTKEEALEAAEKSRLKYCKDRLVFVCDGDRIIGCCNVDSQRFASAKDISECIEPVTHIHKNSTLQEALGLMISAGIANIVVTGDKDSFLGILSFIDMTDFLQMHQEEETSKSKQELRKCPETGG